MRVQYRLSDSKLLLREFGRNIQSMVEYAMTITDYYQRTKVAEQIATTIMHLHPNVKENADFQQYVWDSIFIMSNLELEVDSPFPKPTLEQIQPKKPKRLPYAQEKPLFAQYGKNVHLLIQKACETDDMYVREDYIYKAVNFMRLCLADLNKESYLEHTIVEHIARMSDGRIQLNPKDLYLDKNAQKEMQAFSRANLEKQRANMNASVNMSTKRQASPSAQNRERKPNNRMSNDRDNRGGNGGGGGRNMNGGNGGRNNGGGGNGNNNNRRGGSGGGNQRPPQRRK